MPIELRRHWKEPYGFALYSVLTLISGLETLTRLTIPSKPVHIMYDDKPAFVPVANKLFNMFKNLIPASSGLFGTLTMGDDKECPPLQAADLLVWNATKRYLKPQPHPTIKKVMETLESSGRVVIADLKEANLRRYVEFVKDAIGHDAGRR